MSDSSASQAGGAYPTVPNPAQLTEQSRDFAAEIYAALSDEYLAFRRHYYHESNPSLETAPPIPYRQIVLTARIMDEIFAQIYSDSAVRRVKQSECAAV